jgi:hypothetical protein
VEDARVRHNVSPIPAHQLAVLRTAPATSAWPYGGPTRCHSSADAFPYRYTGYIRGMGETFAKTPVMAQWETKEPSPDSFLYARSKVCTALGNVGHPCNCMVRPLQQVAHSVDLQAPPETSAVDAARDANSSPEAHGVTAHHDVLWPRYSSWNQTTRTPVCQPSLETPTERTKSNLEQRQGGQGGGGAAAL